jgi:protein ImuB
VVGVEDGERPESLLLDITGCGPFFKGERALATRLLTDLHRQRYGTRIAIADTIGTAWAIAHTSGEELVIVPTGAQAEALCPLRVESLRLSDATLKLLHQFDTWRVGQLLALPRADLPCRFGGDVVRRIDQALGIVPEVVTPEPNAEPLECSWVCEPPLADRRTIEAILEHLLQQILDRLRPRLLGIERLLGYLRTVDGTSVSLRVGLLQASASSQYLMSLVRAHCERLQVPGEVSEIRLRAAAVKPLARCQTQLFELEVGANRWHQLPVLIERLSSRLGEKAVLRPRLWPDAQPEYAWRCEPWLRQDLSARQRGGIRPRTAALAQPRPTCVKARPVEIVVVSIIPGGPPLRFEWQQQSHIVVHTWGPERVETGWWRGSDVRREYYVVETTTGQRFWLFRTLDVERWFLHGTFG